MTIPSKLTINGQKLSGLQTTFNAPFPGLPAWRLETLVRDPVVMHLYRHDDAFSGMYPVVVDIFNNHDTAWLKGLAGSQEFTLPPHTGRSFVDDDAMAHACGAEKDKTSTGLTLFKTGPADKNFEAGLKYPDVDVTWHTGSGNKRFWQPETAWVEVYGATRSAVRWFDAYRQKQVLRPRWNFAPNGLPSPKKQSNFDEWDLVAGLNGWDTQHLDGTELCHGVKLFKSAPHFMAAWNLYQQVRANSLQLAMVEDQDYTGSSRVPGWFFAFCAEMLEALDACEEHPYLEQLRGLILSDARWHLDNCLRIHPMQNPWYYGSFPVPNKLKLNYWTYQFSIKWWGALSLASWAAGEGGSVGDALWAVASELADKIHDHLMTLWLPAEGVFANWVTVDYQHSEPTSVPGVGSWFGPPSMLAKTLGLKSADEFRTVVDANIAYFGKDNPLKADSVNLLRPEMSFFLGAQK